MTRRTPKGTNPLSGSQISAEHFAAMANPIQQGLKPGDGMSHQITVSVAAMANPIQQGLKHRDAIRAGIAGDGAAMANPIQQGLKQFSTRREARARIRRNG